MRTTFILASLAITTMAPKAAGADGPQSYELRSLRGVGQIDHASVVLEANGDLLVRSGSGSASEKAERREVNLTCRRDYDEKMLQLPSGSDKTYRAIRYYREASAKLQKGTVALNPSLRPDRRLVGVEIIGPKVTPFAPRGPLSVDELEVLSAVGETLPLDELLPAKAVKIGDSWAVPDETVAVLLGLDEVTTNTLQTSLKEVTPEFARLEVSGRVEGKLYGAMNQITLRAKCRFDRRTQRIDWFAMGLQQTRDVGMVEAGLDWSFQVKVRVTPLAAAEELSEKVLADLPLKPTDELLLVQYLLDRGDIQLTHDRSWFLTGHSTDQDEFHRLDGGRDIGLCKVAPLPQVSVSKLPTAPQFVDIVRKALGNNFNETADVSEARNDAHLRILRVAVKGKDGDVPARWFYYHVSDPEGRQVTLTFRVEEKDAEAFGRADEALVQSVRFMEKKNL